MSTPKRIMVDGNEAVASVAYRTNEVIAIYPITPSSVMGEHADAWAAHGRANLWGATPSVVEMQSEAGAAGAVHGSLQGGALTTTFTSSQGLLLMVPNLYKIAGELTTCCMHVAARAVATHALSIFGDHSDVMACRQTGFALLASGSVQEAHDMACIGQAATLASRVPFMHFFDGFRTSHEIQKIAELSDDDLRAMIRDDLIAAHRERALTPDRPVIRGTAENPDTFFQAREAANSFYADCPRVVQDTMRQFGDLTGRHYGLFDYAGHPEAESVIVMMGSGAKAAREAVAWLTDRGERVGVLEIRLYRPFSVGRFLEALPPSVRRIAVLDRTKEPGAIGEPLYLDVVTALAEAQRDVRVVGGRYGLSSKEFTPAMVRGVFANLDAATPKNHFTVGIVDDVTHTSLDFDPAFDVEPDDVVRAVFWGLGSDGTVGANKNSIKIIGSDTDLNAQGYFVYDSKKAGAVTISHLRFGPHEIDSSYLINRASFVACHSWGFLDRYDVLDKAGPGAVLLLNSPYDASTVWDHLPVEVQNEILAKDLRLWVIDAGSVAQEVGLGSRINTVMQTCFFTISGVIDADQANDRIKAAIEKTYGKLGGEIVKRNFAAVDAALEHLQRVEYPREATATRKRRPAVPEAAPDFVKTVTAAMLANKGDALPVSAFPVDGTWPVATSQWEKRGIAREIPIWDKSICIQCNQCAFVCPHAAIRAKAYPAERLASAPARFESEPCRISGLDDLTYTLQVAPDDCTGCRLCVEVCPAKDKGNPRHKAIDMAPRLEHAERESENYAFFLALPEIDRTRIERVDARGSQLFRPLFEYSGACAGCGETPYVKLLTQLFGDRALIANATGCSSIYGGNLPTTPYCTGADGRGPAWANSLFEDNAEFGLGLRLAADSHRSYLQSLLRRFAGQVGRATVAALLEPEPGERGIQEARRHVAVLKEKLASADDSAALRLVADADWLVPKSVWLVGGDGWAYDIGYGGLDHVLSMDRNVNVLVLDTEVYSNTGGQQSKATPLGAAAKFATAGKSIAKKDLGMEAMSYGHVFVARVAFGAKINQTVKALLEAEAYPGPSIVIAYSHCVAHGYDMRFGAQQQKLAVESGVWPLYRHDPRRARAGEPALKLDSGKPKAAVAEYMKNEARFRMVERLDPQRFKRLQAAAQDDATRRFSLYQQLAGVTLPAVDRTSDTNGE